MKQTAILLNLTVDDFIANAADVNWDNHTAPGKWTNKETLGHLIDSAHINLQRFVRCTFEEGFKLIYHQDEWVKAQHYAIANAAELLKLWELVNLQIVRVLANYPADRTQITCDNNRGEPIYNTIEFIAQDYVAHMQHHLKQLV
ncbi:DinB family protein [Inquilinus sp. KBS0705]|nr:DinB family protein [Inquilinus sp. KBS0705]